MRMHGWRLLPHNCPGRYYQQQSRACNADPMTMLGHSSHGGSSSYEMRRQQEPRYDEELACSRRAYSREVMRSLEELELNRIELKPPPPPRHHHSYQHIQHQRRTATAYDSHQLSGSWSSERPYATLPKQRAPRLGGAAACVRLEEQFLPKDLRRLSRYPQSLQDLKYLEIEAILGRDRPPRQQAPRRPPATTIIDDSLFLEGLAGTSGQRQRQVERYEPGKVHYEREYRVYGKDTVALIFYKTCYL